MHHSVVLDTWKASPDKHRVLRCVNYLLPHGARVVSSESKGLGGNDRATSAKANSQFVYVTFGQGADQPSIIGSKRADGRPSLHRLYHPDCLECLVIPRHLGASMALFQALEQFPPVKSGWPLDVIVVIRRSQRAWTRMEDV